MTEKQDDASSAPVERDVIRIMVAILFARDDSNYKALPGVDVWDKTRDARLWPGGSQVVAHPPCRAWAGLRHMAKPRDGEKDLARFAVAMVRKYGGVLEHPARSTLWTDQKLPMPREIDEYGGWTLPISQHWFGHRAEKMTWLYILGCTPQNLPDIPMVLGEASFILGTSGRRKDGTRCRRRPEITKAEREHTPPDLAVWLVETARRCKTYNVELTSPHDEG